MVWNSKTTNILLVILSTVFLLALGCNEQETETQDGISLADQPESDIGGRAVFGAETKKITIERSSIANDKILELPTDSVAVLEFITNPASGFDWIAESIDTSVVQILGEEFIHPEKDVLGASAIKRVYVSGVNAGNTNVEFVYRQHFENNVEDAIQFKFKSLGKFIGKFELPKLEVSPESELQVKSVDPKLQGRFNWCDDNGCTVVKNQGSCGSCWAFAAVAVLEANIKIIDGDDVDLAEQYLVSCATDQSGCNGGWCPFHGLKQKHLLEILQEL
jgi:predicted secreted protein